MRCIRGLIALVRELWGSRIICWKKLHKGKFSSFVDLWSFWKWKRNEKFSRINSDFFPQKQKKILRRRNFETFISNLNTNEVCCHWTGWCSKCLNLILSRRDDLWGLIHCASLFFDSCHPENSFDAGDSLVLWSWGLGFFCRWVCSNPSLWWRDNSA